LIEGVKPIHGLKFVASRLQFLFKFGEHKAADLKKMRRLLFEGANPIHALKLLASRSCGCLSLKTLFCDSNPGALHKLKGASGKKKAHDYAARPRQILGFDESLQSSCASEDRLAELWGSTSPSVLFIFEILRKKIKRHEVWIKKVRARRAP
jgi:hypothetical protein